MKYSRGVSACDLYLPFQPHQTVPGETQRGFCKRSCYSDIALRPPERTADEANPSCGVFNKVTTSHLVSKRKLPQLRNSSIHLLLLLPINTELHCKTKLNSIIHAWTLKSYIYPNLHWFKNPLVCNGNVDAFFPASAHFLTDFYRNRAPCWSI